MARIVFISPYLKGGKNAAKLAHRTRYFATRPGVELVTDAQSELPATKKQQAFITRLLKQFPDSRELLEYEDYQSAPTRGNAAAFIQQVWEDYVEALEQKGNFIDYISHRPGVQKDGEHGLWDANGKVQNLSAVVKEVSEHPGNVWTPVVALRREDAERLGYANAENWRALVNASLCDIAAAYKIRLGHLRWYAAFHRKPTQVHIHLLIFSTNPKEGYLTKEGIRQAKSAFARRIYAADRMHIYQRKDHARTELQSEARRRMAECIEELNCGTIENPHLEQLVMELAERLRVTKGRKVYGYLPPRTKAIADAIVEELAKSPQVASAYEVWQTLHEQVCLDYNRQLPERVPLSQQKEFKMVRNMVVREALKLSEQTITPKPVQQIGESGEAPMREKPAPALSDFEEVVAEQRFEKLEEQSEVSSDEPPDDAPPKMPEQDAATPPPTAPPQRSSSYRAPPLSEAAVRMLHHMGNIFRDAALRDSTYGGIQIDRKRRQELRELRAALGHPEDDHEDETLYHVNDPRIM